MTSKHFGGVIKKLAKARSGKVLFSIASFVFLAFITYVLGELYFPSWLESLGLRSPMTDQRNGIDTVYSPQSSIIKTIYVNSDVFRPNDTLVVSIMTYSSQVMCFGLFSDSKNSKIKVNGTFSRNFGGVHIKFRIPYDAKSGTYEATVSVLPLSGINEEKRVIRYEVIRVDTNVFNSLLKSFEQVRADTFLMGSNRGRNDEMPVQLVSVGSFHIMNHELTVKEVKQIFGLGDTLIPFGTEEIRGALGLLEGPTDIGQYPCPLTFQQALNICDMLESRYGISFRLPTEAEWEYAARGGLTDKDFPWGNLDEQFNGIVVEEIVDSVHGREIVYEGSEVFPVMTRSPANRFGLYDMAGNLWEWTQSIYRKYPYVDSKVETDSESTRRAIRGGGRAEESFDVRVSFRGIADESSKFGCRLVF